MAVLPDQEQQFLYVGDGAAVDIVDRKSLELIGEIKPPGIVSSHLITSDPKGNIYCCGNHHGGLDQHETHISYWSTPIT